MNLQSRNTAPDVEHGVIARLESPLSPGDQIITYTEVMLGLNYTHDSAKLARQVLDVMSFQEEQPNMDMSNVVYFPRGIFRDAFNEAILMPEPAMTKPDFSEYDDLF